MFEHFQYGGFYWGASFGGGGGGEDAMHFEISQALWDYWEQGILRLTPTGHTSLFR